MLPSALVLSESVMAIHRTWQPVPHIWKVLAAVATKPVLVDSGPLVALLSKTQRQHKSCRDTFATLQTPLLTCWPVLTEAAYLLQYHPAEVRALLSSADGGFLQILPLSRADIPRINTILAKYEDQSFQLADATLMWLAEREGIQHVFTLDRRDFGVYRTSSGQPLQILPTSVA